MCVASAAVALLAVVTVSAQFGVFAPQFEGELWELVDELPPPDGGAPIGVTYFNSELFVADSENATIIRYDINRNVVPLPDADWAPGQVDDLLSPVYGWQPNQLATATVKVGTGPDQTAILVSDFAENRLLAFTTAGEHLFTMRLNSPQEGPHEKAINGMAMGPGAKFNLAPGLTLELVGSFAVAWSEGFGYVGATMAFRSQTFPSTGLEFFATPQTVLRGDEGAPTLPGEESLEPFGVTFDSLGNLYVVDAVTERVAVYSPGPSFTRLFSFGTPSGDGTTDEFFQSYGIQYWPDASGGRLFIADAINNRVVAYRPNLASKTLDPIFAMDGLGALDGYPYSLALDPSTGTIAVQDDLSPRVWILKTPDLAAFQFRVLDDGGNSVEVVCSGDPSVSRPPDQYTVQFSLTVPAGRDVVTGVEPQLKVNGVETLVTPVPGATYPGTTLQAGDVMTFSYALTAPNDGSVGVIELEGGVDVSTASATDILTRQFTLVVSDCQGPPPVITATPGIPAQLSGWTAVYADQRYSITLDATDPAGVQRIDYQVLGANHTIPLDPVPNPNPGSTSQQLIRFLDQMGDTTVEFRAWNDNYAKSDWETTPLLRLVSVLDLQNSEGDTVSQLSIGNPVDRSGITFTATGLPLGLTMDPATGAISGTVGHDALRTYHVRVTETGGTGSTFVEFDWRVVDVNRVPLALNDSYSTNEDSTLTVAAADGVLANDTADPDGDAVEARLVAGPSVGVLVLNLDGSFDYTPPANFQGSDSFSYHVYDSIGFSNEATVSLTVRSVNDAPSFTAGADQTVTEDAGPRTVSAWATVISAGPPDESAQTLTFLVTNSNTALFSSQPAIAPNGTLTYTPAPNAFGNATVTVKLTDNGGTVNGGVDASAERTFRITVNPANDAPVAKNDSYIFDEDTMLNVSAAAGVLANDTDVDGPTLTANLVAGPSSGTLQLNLDGSFTYMPAANSYGNVSFTYKAFDGANESAVATVALTGRAVNDAPVLTNPGPQVGIEGANVSLQITASDPDSPALTFTALNLPPGLSINSATGAITGQLSYSSAGTHTVTVSASDGLLSDSEIFTWTVSNTDPPVAGCVIVDFREITYFKGERVITSSDAGIRARNGIAGPFNPLLWPYSPTASATSTTATKSRGTLFRLYGFKASELGNLVRNADNPAIVYPVLLDPMIAGAYYIDTLGPARVSVCPEQLHNYALDTLNLPGDMPGTAMLPAAQRNVPGVMLSHNTQIVRLPARIKTEMEALGLDPTPKGLIDFVGYQLQGYGSAAFKEFVDVQFAWAEDSETDRAVHFEKGFHTAMTHDLEGSVSCDYLDRAAGDDAMRLRDFWGFNRRSGVTYPAWQACGAREPAANQKKRANYVVPFNAVQILPTVNVNVDSLRMFYGEIRPVIENRAPNAVADTASVAKGATAYIAVLANDSDPDSDALTVSAITAPSKGTASIQANGTIKYVAPTTLTAPTTTTFTYTVSDGRGGTDTATVTVTLTVPNRAPIAVNDSVSVAKGASKVITVLANDSDPDGNPLTVSIASAPAKGSAVANANGTVTYTAPSNFTGTTSFTYKVSDGNGGTGTATVTISVTGHR